MRVLVTGSNGQLGQELRILSTRYTELLFDFFDKEALDIVDPDAVDRLIGPGNYDFCINSAAYTAVDLAETEPEQAFAVNKVGAGNLARACMAAGVRLIHISTDFVFDGKQSIPYKESDTPHPLGIYGQSKYEGELAVSAVVDSQAIVFRTSWLYSSFGKNFVKTISDLSYRRSSLGVVYDQVGGPTYAADLAATILQLIHEKADDWQPGIYHYSNEGVASWYDLAVSIVEEAGSDCTVNPLETWQYPTAAKRAPFTVLHKQKIKDYLKITIPHWRHSLRRCMHLLKEEAHHD